MLLRSGRNIKKKSKGMRSRSKIPASIRIRDRSERSGNILRKTISNVSTKITFKHIRIGNKMPDFLIIFLIWTWGGFLYSPG